MQREALGESDLVERIGQIFFVEQKYDRLVQKIGVSAKRFNEAPILLDARRGGRVDDINDGVNLKKKNKQQQQMDVILATAAVAQAKRTSAK